MVTSALSVSLRLPRLLAQHANEVYANAWTGYAVDAIYPRLADAVNVSASADAIEGDLTHDATFMSHPIDSILSMSPTAKVGIIFRRGIDASHLSPLLTARGIAHKLSTMEGVVTPKASVLAKIRTVAHHISHVQTMSDVLREVPAAGLPVLSLDAVIASAIRILAAELDAHATIIDLTRHAEMHFSDAACSRVWLLTAHASKGQTFTGVYIGQPQFFPLERAVNEGGVSLSQEPRVEYVALTRATHSLIYLRPVEGADENAMEVLATHHHPPHHNPPHNNPVPIPQPRTRAPIA